VVHDAGNKGPRLAQPAALLAHVAVKPLRRLDLPARRFGADRHVAERLLLVAYRHHQRLDPVVIAVLAAVLDHPAPGPARLDGRPEILEGLGRHVGMPDQVVVLADQFVAGEAAQFDEGLVRIRDDPAQIGPRDDDPSPGIGMLDVGHRKIGFHGVSSFVGVGSTFLFV